MSGIQPQQLTNEELVRYASLMSYGTVPAEWVAELIKRLEATLDDGK